METIYVFSTKNNIYGYCRSENGSELPTELNGKAISWQPLRTLHIQENEPPRLGLNVEEMLATIEKQGYYTNRIDINVEITEG